MNGAKKLIMSIADKLIELLKESTLIQGTVTIGVIAVICVLYLSNREVPQTLVDIVMVIVGFWFGSKTNLAYQKGMKAHVSRE
jgi:hypothetical protein